MEGLVIGSAFVGTVDHFLADAADSKWLLYYTLLAVALHILLFTLIRFQEFSYLHHKSMSAFNVLIDVLAFIALFLQLPAFNQKGFILDGLDYTFDEGISGYVAEAFP